MNKRKSYFLTTFFWNAFLFGSTLFCYIDFLSFIQTKIVLSQKDIRIIIQHFVFCTFFLTFSLCFLAISLIRIPNKEKDLTEEELKRMLDESLDNEDFEKAAKIRDLLNLKK